MFQFFLDYYGLAVPCSASRGSGVEFPMTPRDDRTFYDSNLRTLKEIQETLKSAYWANHLLGKNDWSTLRLNKGEREDDKANWGKAANILHALQNGTPVTDEHVKILGEVAQNWQTRLYPIIADLEVPANGSA